MDAQIIFFYVRINKFSLCIVFFSFPLVFFFFFGGGGQKHVLPPTFWIGGGAAAPPAPHFRRLCRATNNTSKGDMKISRRDYSRAKITND